MAEMPDFISPVGINTLMTDFRNNRRMLASYSRKISGMISELIGGYSSKGTASGIPEHIDQPLAWRLADLNRLYREVMLLSKMNDLIQVCASKSEAYSKISETVFQLLPGYSGALYMLKSTRDRLEANARWGENPPATLSFPRAECSALRNSRVHTGDDGPPCPHVDDVESSYLCLPLPAQNGPLGTLHLRISPLDNQGDKGCVKRESELAIIIADNIGLALSNLRLRISMRNGSMNEPLSRQCNRQPVDQPPGPDSTRQNPARSL